jgi:hypothetical protein
MKGRRTIVAVEPLMGYQYACKAVEIVCLWRRTYIAQKASTTATVIFFFLFICNLCTMKMGTILKVQSVTQDSAEYP